MLLCMPPFVRMVWYQPVFQLDTDAEKKTAFAGQENCRTFAAKLYLKLCHIPDPEAWEDHVHSQIRWAAEAV